MSTHRMLLTVLFQAAVLLSFACAREMPRETPAAPEPGPATAPETDPATEITERWESARTPEDNVDSVAFWSGEGGEAWVLATAKEGDRLVIYDAGSGETVGAIGEPGSGSGQLARPNGIAVVEDLAVVVERDNARVQLFRLPGGESAGSFGEGVLRRPYGLTLFAGEDGAYELFVTDNHEAGEGSGLAERVKHFRFWLSGGQLEAEHVASFGAAEGPGALDKVETILADAANDRLLLAEEMEGQQAFVIYGLGGSFSGEVLGGGRFEHEPEGLALRECGTGGYWIATDQGPERSYFRVFERRSLGYVGTFVGETTANTDGVAVTAEAFEGFPDGAFFAVHDDQSVTAFDWRDVVRALGLECPAG